MARATEEDNSLGFYTSPDLASLAGKGEKGKTSVEQAVADANALVNRALAESGGPVVSTSQEITTPQKPLNKMTPDELAAYQADRLKKIENNRLTGNGTPAPTDAPPGYHYSFISGKWTLYPDSGGKGGTGGGKTVLSTEIDDDGNTVITYTDGTKQVIPKSTSSSTNLLSQQNQAAIDAAKLQERQSAYDTLMNEFSKYGLGSLVEGVKGLIQQNVSPSQFAIALQNTKEYQQRFAANQDRIKAGLRALTPAEYIGLEDQYQNIMRNYGLPASYYSKDSMGTQAGFNKLLSNDVSASELEDRIATAQQRVQNSNPEVLRALKQFYPDLNNADILAYTLDPQNALTDIKRKVTAAEIGGAALAQGLQAQGGTAESLAGLGITKAQAQQGYQNVAEMLPRGSQLADIYGQSPYTQQTAEAEVFNTAGSAAAAAKRKKLTALETASFSGSSGVGALGRDKAAYGLTQGQTGLY